jgi:hypothetical protein
MSWGYRIAILLGSFVMLLTFMTIKAFRQNFDLVSEDYYGKEIKFQSQIHKQQNQMNLTHPLTCKMESENIIVLFPKDFEGKAIVGDILLFRPSDAKKDFTVAINAIDGAFLIPKSKFSTGMYKIQIDYKVDDTDYYYENALMIP